MSTASTPTESSIGYSTEEIAEMRIIFDKYDKDGSGQLNTHEFTNALQLMDYKYNEDFVIQVLKLVFDDKWESKQNNLLFDDFIDFMSEFEPVHYEVIDKIEGKLKQKNIIDIETDDPRITNLLKYIEMQNGSLLLNEIDEHLDELQNTDIPKLSKPKSPKSPLGVKSPYSKSRPITPSLPAITENNNIQNAENNNNNNNNHINDGNNNNNDISNISNANLSKQFEENQFHSTELKSDDDNDYILQMNNNQLIEWLNTDKAFNTTMIRKECCDIIQTQQWNGNDMFQALKLNKIDEILLLFKNIQNYEYIIQSLKTFDPADINCNELIQHLEIIKNQQISLQQSEQPQLDQLQSVQTFKFSQSQQMELKPMSSAKPLESMEIAPPVPPRLDNRTLSMTSKAIIDGDDEMYTQNVWKQILRFFDEDNDGTISVNEMAPALRSLGIDVSDTKLTDMISKMDQDKSGSIDYSEFKTYYHALFQEKIKQGLDWKYIQNTFEKYDADSSGFLDIDEFSYALKKMCINITDEDIKSILHLIDTSGDHHIEFEEFTAFLESGHPKADWVLKKLIRSSIPSPIEHLIAFKGVPNHFRKSELAELANHNSFRMSEWIKPKIDIDGITLQNIKIDPKTSEIKRKFKQQNEDNYDENDSKQNDDQYLQNMRVFKLIECSGVPLPEPSIAARIIDRRVRVCLYLNNKAISNVFTIPASWKPTEEDQWKFGTNIWRDSMSNTISEWNTFCVAIDQNINEKIELFMELCVTLKPSNTAKSSILKQAPQQQQISNNMQQQSPMKNNNMQQMGMGMGMQQQSILNLNNNRQQNIASNTTEMSCGWSKLEIHSTNINISNGINRQHKLKIHGGTFNNESNINDSDIRNDRRSSLSFRKLKQALSGVECMVRIQERSYNNIKNNDDKEFMKWIPENVITTVSSCKIIKLYYELMANRWLRNQQIFDFKFYEQNLYETLLLYIIDRPNLLCILIDEWQLKIDSFWRSQRKDETFIISEFKTLLKQFVPLLVHQKLVQHELTSLNQERLSFIKQIIKGNVKQILNGSKPSSSIPLIYTPFNTQIFLY